MSTTTPRLFISYAKEDAAAAARLYTDLAALGANPWRDAENLLPGQDWARAIHEAIRQSDFFLALLSANSVNKRGYVQKEVREALDEADRMPEDQIFIIPVRLESCKPSHERLGALHWVDLFPNWEEGIRKIELTLKNFVPTKALATTTTTPSPTGPLPFNFWQDVEDLSRVMNSSAANTVQSALSLLKMYVVARKTGGDLLFQKQVGEHTVVSSIVIPSGSGVRE